MFLSLTITLRSAPSGTDLNMNTTVRCQRTVQERLPFLSLHPVLCLSYKFSTEALIKKEGMQ